MYVEGGCRDRIRARSVDYSEDEEASSNRHPGDVKLEGCRLRRGIELCKPDGRRFDHRNSTVMLTDLKASSLFAPSRTGTSTQSADDEAKHQAQESSQLYLLTFALLASKWTLNLAHRS